MLELIDIFTIENCSFASKGKERGESKFAGVASVLLEACYASGEQSHERSWDKST